MSCRFSARALRQREIEIVQGGVQRGQLLRLFGGRAGEAGGQRRQAGVVQRAALQRW